MVRRPCAAVYLAEKPKGLAHCRVIDWALAAKLNCATKRITDITDAGSPSSAFIRNVVFHASIKVNLEFARIDGTSETRVVSPCVDIVSVILGVVDMFFRAIYSESVFSDLR
jgi:hypothetical protein